METGMVDIGHKETTLREAVAECGIRLDRGIVKLITERKVPKGDVLEAAKIAGIMSAKKTPFLIPLCHPIAVDFVGIEFSLGKRDIIVRATVRGTGKTGFEMEAMTAVAISALTIYDMCKPLDKGIVISDMMLIRKSGGKSGRWIRG